MAEGSNQLTIRSDADAWQLIELWNSGKEIGEVAFDGWPNLEIKIKGDEYQSSMNSSQMAALVELKKVMGRAYSVLAHGAYDMRRLREEEEEQIQFSTEVKKGSSILNTDFSPLIQAFSGAVATNPTLSVVAATILGLAIVARPVIIRYYDDRAKQLDAKERERLLDLSLNNQERKQVVQFERAVTKIERKLPQFQQAIPDARESFWKLASASVDADKFEVAGIQMSQDDLEVLAARRSRRSSEAQEIEDVFKITGIKAVGSTYRIGLVSKTLTTSAVYRRPQLTEARMKRLTNLFINGTQIKAKITVKVVDQAQLSSRLYSFNPYSPDEDEDW